MTRVQAVDVCERLGVDPADTDPVETILAAVATVDYGNGERATATELAELRAALATLHR